MARVSWFSAARAIPINQVAAALGLRVDHDGRAFGPCPSCALETRANPGRRDRRGRCRIFSSGSGWACNSNGSNGCGAAGDGPGLVAWVLTGNQWRHGDPTTTALVSSWFVEARLLGPSEPVWKPRYPPQQPTTAYPRPPAVEVAATWDQCRNVTEDSDVAKWLDGRGFDPRAVAEMDLVRALPTDRQHPSWARYEGRGWQASGHRLIAPAYEPDPSRPGRLRLASLHARCVRAGSPDDKASNAAAGPGSATGLLFTLNPQDPFLDGEPRRLLTLCEGVTDFLALALQPASSRGALLGTWSGSATPATASLIPAGWTVVLAHDQDHGGDAQAASWLGAIERDGRGIRCRRRSRTPGVGA